MPDPKLIFEALQHFADTVTAKMNTLASGEPEDQLRAPFENLMQEIGKTLSINIVCTGETPLPDRLGRPDYSIQASGMLAGHVELKAPGVGANPTHFKGHNKNQWKRFSALPNLIYTDGNEWALYRWGELIGKRVRLAGDVSTDGSNAVSEKEASNVLGILTDFLQWQPTIPTKSRGQIDLKAFSAMLAPLCGFLRDEVTDVLKNPDSPLVQLSEDWRQLLFPDADDKQFADAYAQTVTFALLLARSEGASLKDLHSAETSLSAEHSLLSRALQVLTDPSAYGEISAQVDILLRVIAEVPISALKTPKEAWLFRDEGTLPLEAATDPWLFFYEDFLSVYDPKLRKDAGAYYTPVEVALAQIRLVDDLLTNRLGKSMGFADKDVITLDPAMGTGTYLLGAIDHAMSRVYKEEGKGAVPGRAKTLAKNIYGFELMVGPYAVSELRITRILHDWGAKLPQKGINVFLTDTLESPNTPPKVLPLYLKPIADQHEKALKVKADVPVMVCIGNPPYDRHEALDPTDEKLSRYGGWVRFGDPLVEETTVVGRGKKAKKKKELSPAQELKKREKYSILYDAFVEPASEAGHSVHLKNLYNLYVYFWRWALWKVFENQTSSGPGVVSFISASSYLDGDAFCGMREHMRRICDELWILDLGGEGRGANKSDNVFAIQTPVTIAVAFRHGEADMDKPAKVHYVRIEGKRAEKLKILDNIKNLGSLKWKTCPSDWHAAFIPQGKGTFFSWPTLDDLMPWSGRGIQFSRTWPVCGDYETVCKRWEKLLSTKDDEQRQMLYETRDAQIDREYLSFHSGKKLPRLNSLTSQENPESIERVFYRSFDRQWCIADRRLIDMPRPPLWNSRSSRQIFIVTLAKAVLKRGPSLVCCLDVPDLNAFNNRGGVSHPLYRDKRGIEPNILPGLLELLAKTYGVKIVTPEEFLAYVYGVLAQSAFTERFAKELGSKELRLPLTKDKKLFQQAVKIGEKLLWLQTYGERYVPKGKHKGQVPKGSAKCTKAVPSDEAGYPEAYEYDPDTQILHVGEGQFAPVSPEIYEFEVSGLKVVQSWLGYRMKEPKGKRSSPLDDINTAEWPSEFTTELLELLWVLEATLAEYPAQAKLLEKIVTGECFTADELPEAPEEMRKPPKRKKAGQGELF